MLNRRVQTALQLLFPPTCAGCGGRVESDFGLCGACWSQVPLITGPVCNSCGSPILSPDADKNAQCEDCLKIARPWNVGRAAFLYRNMGRILVLRLKHADRQDIAQITLPWMEHAARDLLQDGTTIIPVPLHWSRLVKRRYNQAALLAQKLAMQVGHRAVLDGLERNHATKPLDGVTATDRFNRLEGAISANPKRTSELDGKHVLLIDDVMTSGATLAASTEACLAAGATMVNVLVLARVSKDD